jgi:rare lipoprotein A
MKSGFCKKGIASWYGEETLKKKVGFMTANGETFNPKGLTAAHKYPSLPYHVQVTNLENSRSIIVRVNYRGPFTGHQDRLSGDRVIDLSECVQPNNSAFMRRGLPRLRSKPYS